MREEYRVVDAIHLHDANMELTVCGRGIWNELESRRWEISGETVRKWLEALGVKIANVASKGYEVGKRFEPSGVNVEDAYPICVEQPVRSISSVSNGEKVVGWKLTAIGVRIVAAQQLDIRLTVQYENGGIEIREIAYSGGFTIFWAQTEH
jgi:hypothetical protein